MKKKHFMSQKLWIKSLISRPLKQQFLAMPCDWICRTIDHAKPLTLHRLDFNLFDTNFVTNSNWIIAASEYQTKILPRHLRAEISVRVCFLFVTVHPNSLCSMIHIAVNSSTVAGYCEISPNFTSLPCRSFLTNQPSVFIYWISTMIHQVFIILMLDVTYRC